MSPPRPGVRAPIRRLSATTVERIAAGEVVERPASVVKELVENAYDAGASLVTVRLRLGGLERIEVADDGSGIPAEQLPLAVERHATSKLPPEGPIEGIATLGFRGEALGAIAAVARLRLVSRTPEMPLAEGLEVAGGVIGGRLREARSIGTTVQVDHLFYNTPARRKFLKAPAREQVEVVRTLEQLYLARPSASLRLESEAGELLSLPAARSVAEAAGRVLGPEFPRGSFAVAATAPGVAIEARLGGPSLAAAGASGLYLAVNGRPVVSRPLGQAVRVAFGETIPRSRYPVGVVHLTVAAGDIDVNVHPTKREVRLAAAREIEEALRRSVRAALDESSPLAEPSRGSLGVRSPGSDRPVPGRARPAPVPPVGRPVRQAALVPPGIEGAVVPASGPRPRLELLGPVGALYWVAATDDGLVLVDQHAASERLLYGALLDGGRIARQALVVPVPIALSGAERASLEAHADAVRAAGFEVEPFGPASYRVLSVPTYRGRCAPASAVTELLRELADGGRPTVPDGLAARRAASIACHAAIRAGDVVERSTIAELLAALDRRPDHPRSCPHGRPILVHLPRSRLDRWFGRSGL